MKRYNKAILYSYLFFTTAVVWSCKKDLSGAGPMASLSGDARITNLTTNGQIRTASIDAGSYTASITMPHRANFTAISTNLSQILNCS